MERDLRALQADRAKADRDATQAADALRALEANFSAVEARCRVLEEQVRAPRMDGDRVCAFRRTNLHPLPAHVAGAR